MRENKFRAFVKNKNIIVKVDKINFENKIIVTYLDELPFPTSAVYSFEDIELMQYIGLKDKNGKEIYEGDIVRKKCNYLNTGETKIRLYKVVWKEEWCAWALKKLGNCTQSCYMYKNELDFCEIVGNIYENPELLEENE